MGVRPTRILRRHSNYSASHEIHCSGTQSDSPTTISAIGIRSSLKAQIKVTQGDMKILDPSGGKEQCWHDHHSSTLLSCSQNNVSLDALVMKVWQLPCRILAIRPDGMIIKHSKRSSTNPIWCCPGSFQSCPSNETTTRDDGRGRSLRWALACSFSSSSMSKCWHSSLKDFSSQYLASFGSHGRPCPPVA